MIPKYYSEIINLYKDGLSLEEISRELGVNIQMVKRAINKRKRIASVFSKHYSGARRYK